MLCSLGEETFQDAYAGQIDREDLEAYIGEYFSEQSQASELSDPNSIFLIAELDGMPIGYAKLSMNSLSESVNGERPMEIRRIYLLQKHIGVGRGSELIKRCISEASERDCDTIWLGVWESNHRAIAFYRKWGFKEVGAQSFKLGNVLQRDLIMERPLVLD